MSYDTNYPTELIGGGNPYHRCALCGRSDPDINGEIARHNSWCDYRQAMETHGVWPAPAAPMDSTIHEAADPPAASTVQEQQQATTPGAAMSPERQSP